MACDPHPQIVSPCSDDAVSVGQALGTRGDVHFDEYGSTILTEGQTTVDVTFNYEKESASYVFEYLYVANPDELPDDIRAIVNSQTTAGFQVELSGEPTSATSVLYWHVIVPDALHTCQPLTNGPHYSILRTEQHGVTPLVSGQDYLIVNFPTNMPDTDWGFEQFSIEKAFAESDPQVFAWTCTRHVIGGFTIQFSGHPTDGTYSLRWQVR